MFTEVTLLEYLFNFYSVRKQQNKASIPVILRFSFCTIDKIDFLWNQSPPPSTCHKRFLSPGYFSRYCLQAEQTQEKTLYYRYCTLSYTSVFKDYLKSNYFAIYNHRQTTTERTFNKIVESEINNIALPYTSFLINPFLI